MRKPLTPEEIATADPKRLKHNEQCRRWREANRERSREIARKSALKYVQNNRDKHRESKRRVRAKLRQEILAFFGGKCVRCGFDDWRALQLDHINGDGYIERIVNKVPQMNSFRKWLRINPEEYRRKFQCLCANCNWIKRHENCEHGGDGRRKSRKCELSDFI